jgi:CheY-like chemotaxis protein
MTKIKSILLIDNNEIDNFINHKIAENYGVTNIVTFKSADNALDFLLKTKIKFQFIIVDLYLPMTDGFQFIDKFNELELYKTQGEICLLSASINPAHKKQSAERNVRFIEKPLTIEKLLPKH